MGWSEMRYDEVVDEQAAEIDAMRAENENLKGVQDKLYEERDDALHQAERLAHENERLLTFAHEQEEGWRQATFEIARLTAQLAEARGHNGANVLSGEHAIHPKYGPCDAFETGGACSECVSVVERLRARVAELEAEEMVRREPWNNYPVNPNRKVCGADDGATVCVLPVGHPIGHKSETGRVWV